MLTTQKVPAATLEPMPTIDFETALNKASPKDRTNITRFLDALAATPGNHADLWRQMFCGMATLSPHAIQSSGQLAVRFYVADGKHRLQIFALEDTREGMLNLYIPDCIDQAITKKVLGKPVETEDDALLYAVRDTDGASLRIRPLTAAATINAPDFFKHMLGWNRKAVCISLPVTASPAEIRAAGLLCKLGAELRVPEGAPRTGK